MNLQEIIDECSAQLRNTKIQGDIIRWTNMTLVELGTKYVFPVLNAYDTSKSTAAGNPDVVLAADFHLMKWLTIPVEDKIPTPTTHTRLAETDAQFRSRQGSISMVYMSAEKTVGFYQVPDGVKNFHYGYQRRVATLPGVNLTAETPELPLEWHPFIINEICIKGYSYESNLPQINECEARRKRMIKELKPVLYRNLFTTHVMESETRLSRLPRPQLPGNYPNPWA